MKIKKEVVGNYSYVFEFAFDMSIVNFCRQIKEEYSKEEFTFDMNTKCWRFTNLEIVDKILSKYLDASVHANMYDDIISFEEEKKWAKELTVRFIKNP